MDYHIENSVEFLIASLFGNVNRVSRDSIAINAILNGLGGGEALARAWESMVQDRANAAFDDTPVPVTLSADEFAGMCRLAFADSCKRHATCPVCLADFVDADQLFVGHCQHYLHVECARGWLLNLRPTCPVCRADLRTFAQPLSKPDTAADA